MKILDSVNQTFHTEQLSVPIQTATHIIIVICSLNSLLTKFNSLKLCSIYAGDSHLC